MATWGYLLPFDEQRAETIWAPTRGAPRGRLTEAFEKNVTDLPRTTILEQLEEWDDDDLRKGLFSEVAVRLECFGEHGPVSFGKHATVDGLRKRVERRFGTDGPASVLRRIEQLDRVEGETGFDLVPVPRAMLRELWAALQQAAPAQTALAPAEVFDRQELLAADSDEFALTALAFIGWVLASTEYGIAFVFEELPSVHRPPPPPPGAEAVRDELLERGLPVWTHVDDETRSLQWVRVLDEYTYRTHCWATVSGELRHSEFQRPSRWQRFWGNAEWRHLGTKPGPCADSACLDCKAATLAGERLRALSPAAAP